jgi:hypothetical protein
MTKIDVSEKLSPVPNSICGVHVSTLFERDAL